MILEINLNGIYRQTAEVVCKEAGEELFIVLANSGIAEREDALFTLKGTGKLIWQLLDGTNSVQQVIDQMLQQYDVPAVVLKQDTIAFLEELAVRGMITE